jgi:F-type H+-transporting ATPase subunit delta
VTPRSAARRYAGALLDVTRTGEDLDRAAGDLAAFRDLVAGHDELRRVFETPSVSSHKKRALVEALLAAAGDTGPAVSRLLLFMADRDRLTLLPEVAASFAARVLEAKRIVPADVVTAVPLDENRRVALVQALGRAAGGAVVMSERVDPSILGGVVARVGSVVFDGSVTRQLDRLKARLMADA